MMTARLLKRSVPIAVMGGALGLLGVSSVSSGDTGDHDRDYGKEHDKNHNGECDRGHNRDPNQICFKMVVSGGAANCLPRATARVTVTSLGPVEKMHVDVSGLPPNTDFDFFVIQVPKAPFGLSWYQGDIDTDDHGRGSGDFIGRFSIETFIVSPQPGGAPAQVVHRDGPFPDASSSMAFNPTHTFHLGLWFNSPEDAMNAGCANTVTPFNGEHNAGIQVLNTSNFPDNHGPLSDLQP